MVGMFKKIELHHIWSKSLKPQARYVNFRFFNIVAVAILIFESFKFLTVGMVKRVELCHLPNFVKITRTSAEILRFFKMAAAAILKF